jgi:hypothetical protein
LRRCQEHRGKERESRNTFGAGRLEDLIQSHNRRFISHCSPRK